MSNVDIGRAHTSSYRQTLAMALGSSAVAGLAFGLWQNNAPGSVWTLAVAGSAAILSARWMWRALAMRRPAMDAATLTPRQAPRLAPPAPAQAERRGATAQERAAATARGSVEDERSRLKAAGFNDAEISQILVARATGGGQARSAFGTGTATGLLNNVDAILTHGRNLLPSFKANLEHMFDERADKATRIGAALSFGVKVAALVVVGYLLYLESVELRARAMTQWAQACIERQKNAINHATMDDLMSGKVLDGDQECGGK